MVVNGEQWWEGEGGALGKASDSRGGGGEEGLEGGIA